MDGSATDVSRTVEYSVDKWFMNRVPGALLFCLVGLAIILYSDSGGRNGAAQAFLYLALLGLVFTVVAVATLLEKWFERSAPFVAAILLICIVVAVVALISGSPSVRRPWSTVVVDPPTHVFGWMLVYLGTGWITYALVRHFYPARPILMLSPAGVSYHRHWLRDVRIPWQQVQRVGNLEIENASNAASIFPHVTVVVVTQAFYEREVAPKRGFLMPPGSELMFRPKGETMQIVLNNTELVVDPGDFREPAEARWKAFRHQPAPAGSGGLSATGIVYGRWSIDGSWWQAIQFVAPLVGMVAVVLHASGIWPF
jgi:hypothetical protein